MKVSDFRLLTDENIDPEFVVFLRKKGFDVFDVKENGLFQATDSFLLNLAVDTKRVVITLDSDFGTLVYRDKQNFIGIIYLRPGHFATQYHIQTFEAILHANPSLIEPFMIIAEWNEVGVKIRIRNEVG